MSDLEDHIAAQAIQLSADVRDDLAAAGLETCNFYSEANRKLTDDELAERFGGDRG